MKKEHVVEACITIFLSVFTVFLLVAVFFLSLMMARCAVGCPPPPCPCFDEEPSVAPVPACDDQRIHQPHSGDDLAPDVIPSDSTDVTITEVTI